MKLTNPNIDDTVAATDNKEEEVLVIDTHPMKPIAKRDSSMSLLSMASDYNDNSAVQAYAASLLTDFLYDAAEKLHSVLPEDKPFQVCEYGCSTGGSSLDPLRAIQDAIGDRPLRANMVDLPMNDWDVLRSTLDPAFDGAIDFEYTPKSMYDRISEEASVCLAYSCFAQHWLDDGAPTGLPEGALWSNQLTKSSKQRKIWKEASMRDWESLLSFRAKEIIPGGMLVLHIQSSMANGQLSETFAATCQKAKLRMIEAGQLSEALAQSMVIPEYMKAPDEILSPLSSGKSMERFWKVEEMQYRALPCAYTKEFHQSCHEEPLAREDIVGRQIGYLQAFMGTSLTECIGKEKTSIFWNHVRSLAGNNPELLSSEYMSTFIVLKRTRVEA